MYIHVCSEKRLLSFDFSRLRQLQIFDLHYLVKVSQNLSYNYIAWYFQVIYCIL